MRAVPLLVIVLSCGLVTCGIDGLGRQIEDVRRAQLQKQDRNALITCLMTQNRIEDCR